MSGWYGWLQKFLKHAGIVRSLGRSFARPLAVQRGQSPAFEDMQDSQTGAAKLGWVNENGDGQHFAWDHDQDKQVQTREQFKKKLQRLRQQPALDSAVGSCTEILHSSACDIHCHQRPCALSKDGMGSKPATLLQQAS